MKKRNASQHPGRPITVHADTALSFRAPANLIAQVTAAAKRENISASEWWRRAAGEKLTRAATTAR